MTVVKKTVAINPIMDDHIRQTWSILIRDGHDASYSTALNLMLLGEILSYTEDSEEKRIEYLRSFLKDEKSIQELNLEDYANKVDELFRKKEKDRDLT